MPAGKRKNGKFFSRLDGETIISAFSDENILFALMMIRIWGISVSSGILYID
jgi:hypothetical protein